MPIALNSRNAVFFPCDGVSKTLFLCLLSGVILESLSGDGDDDGAELKMHRWPRNKVQARHVQCVTGMVAKSMS